MSKQAEYLDINGEPIIEDEDMGEVIMEEPFNPVLINIETQTPVLYNIISRLKASPPEIDLYPDFQRKDNLWDEVHPGLDPGRTDLLGIVFHQQGAGGKIDRGMRNPGQ